MKVDGPRGDIRNVKVVLKHGAHGNSDAVGIWIYGKRRDGKTVPCKNRPLEDGGIAIWSEYFIGSDFHEDVTTYTGVEWKKIQEASKMHQSFFANFILESRE